MSTLIIIGTILSNTLLYATPLIFAALGGVFSERSGVVNIGLEGLMTIGAFSAAVTTIDSGSPWLGLVVAMVAGAIFAIPHAIASISFQADQVVSGVALNFLGGGIALFLTKMLFNGAAQTQTVEQPFTKVSVGGISNVPILGDILTAYPTTYLAIILVVLTYVLLYKTPWGLRLRSVGEHPRAADTLGINVYSGDHQRCAGGNRRRVHVHRDHQQLYVQHDFRPRVYGVGCNDFRKMAPIRCDVGLFILWFCDFLGSYQPDFGVDTLRSQRMVEYAAVYPDHTSTGRRGWAGGSASCRWKTI
jgi:hypothetical protein